MNLFGLSSAFQQQDRLSDLIMLYFSAETRTTCDHLNLIQNVSLDQIIQ